MRKLILVRHSAPDIAPEIPAREWHLSEAGRSRCAALARRLLPHAPDCIITSTEPKAIETGEIVAQILGKPLETGQDLHEHERGSTGFLTSERFTASVTRFFEQPNQLVFGRETADAAYQRFAGGVADVMQLHPDENVAIVAHGTVIALFVARATGQEPLPLWKRLGLPSFVVLSLPGPKVLTIIDNVAIGKD